MTESKIDVTVSVKGIPRRLFSVKEAKNGDAYILARSQVGDVGTSVEVVQNKYTIHQSLQSVFGVNCIKHTRKLADGTKEYEKVLYTKAIKKTNKWAHIYIERCGDLSFLPHSNSGVSLGEYDANKQTFVFSVLVGQRGKTDESRTISDFKSTTLTLSKFNLIILQRTIMRPTIHNGCSLSPYSVPFDQIADGEEPPFSSGLDDIEAILTFIDISGKLCGDFFYKQHTI